jgi:hypothetical protein
MQATVVAENISDQARQYRNCSSRSLSVVCFVTRRSAASTDQDFIPGHLRKFHKIVKEGLFRGPDRIFIQELPRSIPEELSCKHL